MNKKRTAVIFLMTMIGGMVATLSKSSVAFASPSELAFVDKEQLLSEYSLNDGTVTHIKFGTDGHTWLIAGKEDESTIALLTAESFGTSVYGKTSIYGESSIKSLLDEYRSNNTVFSEGEKSYMKTIEVATEDAEGFLHKDSGTLYLPDTKAGRAGMGSTTICVGTANNIEIPLAILTEENGFHSICFWLRSPREDRNSYAQLAYPEGKVGCMLVGDAFGVLPVFHLDLSKVVFASTVNAAGKDTVAQDGELSSDLAMTLRYDAGTSLGTAIISEDGKNVTLKKVPADTYLVVQNSDGTCAYLLSETVENTEIGVNTITICSQSPDSFHDCKVWLESTDADRITTACMATLPRTQQLNPIVMLTVIALVLILIAGSIAIYFNKRNSKK